MASLPMDNKVSFDMSGCEKEQICSRPPVRAPEGGTVLGGVPHDAVIRSSDVDRRGVLDGQRLRRRGRAFAHLGRRVAGSGQVQVRQLSLDRGLVAKLGDGETVRSR